MLQLVNMNKIGYSVLIKTINRIDGALLENNINFTDTTKENGDAFENKSINYTSDQ